MAFGMTLTYEPASTVDSRHVITCSSIDKAITENVKIQTVPYKGTSWSFLNHI
jgi:hypothetical protein